LYANVVPVEIDHGETVCLLADGHIDAILFQRIREMVHIMASYQRALLKLGQVLLRIRI